MFDLDRPIELQEHDQLDLLPFARTLAKSIAGQRVGDGFVIAIDGEWGSGKTSTINLALRELRRIELEELRIEEGKQTIVYRFEPWLYPGREHLMVEFFSGLAHALDRPLGHDVAKAMRGVASVLLQRSEQLLNVGMLGITAAGGPAAATTTLAMAKELSKRIPESWGKDSLEAQRRRLRELLFRQMRRVVVVIDDIDRLQANETRIMLGMLKSIADLPGVTYLLPVELSRVKHVLSSDGAGWGGAYLQKIVQVTIELPRAASEGLSAFLDSRVNALLTSGPEVKFDESDWDNIAGTVFRTYLRTPRSVVRLTNRLQVSWPAVAGEAYFPDLFGIEALREFEPDLYAYIRDNSESVLRARSQGSQEQQEVVATISGLLRPESRAGGLRLCKYLFPTLGYGRMRSLRLDALGSRRVDEDDGFEIYFRWSLPTHVAAKAEMRAIREDLQNQRDPTAHLATLVKRCARSGVRASTGVLEAVADGELLDPSNRLLMASLLRMSEQLVDVPREATWWNSPHQRLGDAIEVLIQKVSRSEREQLVRTLLLDASISLYGGAKLLLALNPDESEPALEPAVHKALAREWCEQQLFARTDELRSSRLGDVCVNVVKYALGKERAKQLIMANLDAPRLVASIALARMATVNSSARTRLYMELQSLPDADVYDALALSEAVKSIPMDEYSDLERDGLREFAARVPTLMAGNG